MFADSAKIYLISGKGGNGHVSFRRELYVPAGGPDGGDGGNGGDIIFVVDEGMTTLYEYKHKYKFAAQPGAEGSKKRQHGKDGEDLILKVPQGTLIKEASSGKVIADMSDPDMKFTVLKGGRGGKGNQHYATPTMQAPQYAQPGQPAKELEVILELKVIADVGLVGYPNVGKSTLLSRVTNAKPKIANYHFTTLIPNLGVVDLGEGKGFVMADIPGLIEGASEGTGLGHEFLRHIERTRVIIHVVDAASTEGRDPVEDIYKINEELAAFNEDLAKKPQIIAANKIDVIYPGDASEDDNLTRLKKEFEPQGYKIIPISAVAGKGVKELLYAAFDKLQEIGKDPVVYEQEYFPEQFNDNPEEPFTVEKLEEGLYSIEGPRIERMLGYTNLESEKGFMFFQNFMKDNGILQQLEDLGIKDGDTVKIYGHQFDYYK